MPLLAAGRAYIILGVDMAKRPLVQLSAHAPGILVQADAASLPFRDAAFDIVLCRHVLGHLLEEGRKAAASEVLRTLKKGGRALFEGFSTRDFRFGKGKKVEEGTFLRGDGTTHHYFAEDEVARSGQRVWKREVAGRLAMSEADLYRKQRVAVEAVARAILDMEQNEALQ